MFDLLCLAIGIIIGGMVDEYANGRFIKSLLKKKDERWTILIKG